MLRGGCLCNWEEIRSPVLAGHRTRVRVTVLAAGDRGGYRHPCLGTTGDIVHVEGMRIVHASGCCRGICGGGSAGSPPTPTPRGLSSGAEPPCGTEGVCPPQGAACGPESAPAPLARGRAVQLPAVIPPRPRPGGLQPNPFPSPRVPPAPPSPLAR